MPSNQGDVDITLDGDKVTLRCTLRAAKEINSIFGNYVDAFRKLATFDLSAYVAVVAAGLGKTSKEVETAVFNTGLPDLTKPLSDYLGLLSNGGRPAVPADPAKGSDTSGED